MRIIFATSRRLRSGLRCAPFLKASLVVLSVLWTAQAWGTPIIQQIQARDGISLVRVSDDLDHIWSNPAGTSWVTARARRADYKNVFGIIPGTGGGTGGFQALFSAPNQQGLTSLGSAPLVAIDPFVGVGGEFRIAIKTPKGNIWSSSVADNSDGADHMITWVDANDPNHYFVGFEDLVFSDWDADFDDLVLELYNVIDGPSDETAAILQANQTVPEPGALALIAIALAVMGLASVVRK